MQDIRSAYRHTRRAALSLLAAAMPAWSQSRKADPPAAAAMQLGVFSVSLNVKDLAASRRFYEKLGFKPSAGADSKYLIMKNGDCLIGLFQGMFDKNILTFNPGWDINAKKLPAFTDVRELQRRLKAQGVKLSKEADENSTGPAGFFVEDPDGNSILVDQHV